MIREAKRVCRPGGKIVIVNHFTSEIPLVGFLTDILDPMTRRLGWSTKLRLKPLIDEAELKVEAVYKISKGSLYTVLVGANEKDGFRAH
jgi:phosphatidylethanolamine/phosphatidyl-N-methylethanolamine N-methyltransferase